MEGRVGLLAFSAKGRSLEGAVFAAGLLRGTVFLAVLLEAAARTRTARRPCPPSSSGGLGAASPRGAAALPSGDSMRGGGPFVRRSGAASGQNRSQEAAGLRDGRLREQAESRRPERLREQPCREKTSVARAPPPRVFGELTSP